MVYTVFLIAFRHLKMVFRIIAFLITNYYIQDSPNLMLACICIPLLVLARIDNNLQDALQDLDVDALPQVWSHFTEEMLSD